MSISFKKGISLEGESSGSGTINNQDIAITSNGTYTADSGYSGFGVVTVNVPDYVTSGLLYSFGAMTTTVTIGE